MRGLLMSCETPLQKIENECRQNSANGQGPESAVHQINGHSVQVKMARAYTPGNTFSGNHVRFNYYLDGKRTSYGKVWDTVCK
jgi:hypothetical protein